ncbi:hypothetical protein BH11PLA2_BH11PLA2_26690 [soil metagenome]
MDDPVYDNYWKRKQLLNTGAPPFPVRKWWSTPDLCEIEQAYFEPIRVARRVLDVGAGDLRVKDKFVKAGYAGVYHTQDIGGEYEHTYRTLDDVTTLYDAIICFDVIEHLPLRDALAMIRRMVELLDVGGTLLLQTPNAKCIRSPYSWDMTHLHTFNLPDLWAYLTAMDLDVVGYRIWFSGPRDGIVTKGFKFLGKLLVTRFLGADYADNIALLAKRRA